MKLDEILSAAGKHKAAKRIGRGIGSGHGKTSTRGHKGMGARAGSGVRMGYEGGQNPLIARSPKRGFNNYNFRTVYQIVNVFQLERFDDGTRVDRELLAKTNLISDAKKLVKVLGDGALTKKLTVVATKFTASAAAKITAAGGTTEQG